MEALLAQSLKDWELIACDSGSDDGTWEYLMKFEHDRRFRLLRIPREGLYAGWNECLRRASGKYIYIATADDTCEPDLLEKLVGALESDLRTESCTERSADHALPVDIAVCDFDYINEDGVVINPPPRGDARHVYGKWMDTSHLRPGEFELLVHLLVDISWTTMTAVVFRRDLLEKTGLFRTDLGPYADTVWAVRSALFSDTVYVPGRMATWRQHSDQKSSIHKGQYQAKLYEVLKQTIEECSEMIPAQWKTSEQKPGMPWQDALLFATRGRYLASYGLDRTTLRNRPFSFMWGCMQSAIRNPAFLAKRLVSGLSWASPEMADGETMLHMLTREWHIEIKEHGIRPGK